MTTLLRTEGVGRTHVLRGARIDLLDDVTLGVEAGQVTALAGDSGSGKTLLLHILALLETPDRGRVFLGDDDLTALTGPARADTRRRRLGIVFRSPDLLPRHSAYRNVLVPYAGSRAEGERRARDLLDRMDLTRRAAHLPGDLTDDEQRRVALARALINDPPVLLADEPTGGAELMAFFRELADEGRAVVLASADPEVWGIADVVHRLERGVLVGESADPYLEAEDHQLQ
ncbi:ABC transporter ATP-binding protein [Streptomyces acidiscabies]|uniref:Membrane protein n=1 Tax=Streptomyces acidiscabies TaxID=42234 RepID=A0A0L0JKY3_9ACTN|nr:ATP-binding cassette domain-containing protein [Streptomyces acidiscabies]KND26361.1 membrane protein [Streptomyces acidiscabies]